MNKILNKKLTKSMNIIELDAQTISPCSRSPYYPFVPSYGKGANLYDADGNCYIDFSAAAASLNTGTCHPRVVSAIKEQAEKLLCYTIGYMYENTSVKLAEKLIELAPGNFPKKVAYGLSGSDTIDGAIKFARKYTGRSEIITFKTAYHGCTYGALSSSAISLNMRSGIGPMLPGFHHFTYPQCSRCPWKESPDTCAMSCLEEIKEAFNLYLPANEVAAVIMEPIGGDIGMIVPPAKYVKALAELCKEHGILLVSDEVQQGMGRTGKWFCIENYDVTPDIITLSKSLASGMPLSAIIMRSDIADSLMDPAHCFTLAANAVCCSAALATISVIEDEKLIEKSITSGKLITDMLNDLKSTINILGETRGLGLSIGQEILCGNDNKNACAKICWRCWEKGLILTFLGGNVLRIQPPLVITEDEIERGINIIKESITDYQNGLISDKVLSFARGWA